jgi:DNA-directed RNA polymerase subunit RPC12/RpoP
MRSVASLEVDIARILVERLGNEGIVAKLRTTTEESGLEMSQVMVEDDQYERVCDLVEAWQVEETERAQKKSGRRCPKCGSWHLRYAPREPVGQVWQCRDCGSEIVFKNRI